MIRDLGRGIATRNPVWIMPLALPIVLFASGSWDMTILFAVAVPIMLIVTHLVALPFERWLPPDLEIVAMLVTGGVVITLAEQVLYMLGIVLATRPLLLFRAVSVSGVMLWPALIGTRAEPASRRLNRVLRLSLGFALGLILLAALRVPFVLGGFVPAGSVAGGLLLLAFGRVVINHFTVRRERIQREARER